MADEQQQQQPMTMTSGQRSPWPQVRNNSGDDDYVYEVKPLPKKDATGQQQQSGGMGAQFEAVSSGANNNI
jgi:hypothetical protein